MAHQHRLHAPAVVAVHRVAVSLRQQQLLALLAGAVERLALASLARAARLVVGPPVVEEHDVVQHHPADAHPAPVAVVQRGVHLRDVAVHVRRAHADLRQQRLEPVDVERACAERDRLSGGGRGARGESRHGRDRQGEEQAELHC